MHVIMQIISDVCFGEFSPDVVSKLSTSITNHHRHTPKSSEFGDDYKKPILISFFLFLLSSFHLLQIFPVLTWSSALFRVAGEESSAEEMSVQVST